MSRLLGSRTRRTTADASASGFAVLLGVLLPPPLVHAESMRAPAARRAVAASAVRRSMAVLSGGSGASGAEEGALPGACRRAAVQTIHPRQPARVTSAARRTTKQKR